MSNVAFAKRDIKAIQKREKINFIYNAIRKVQRILYGYEPKQIKSIVISPKITNSNELIDMANRVAWAFPYKEDLCIEIEVSNELLSFDFSKVNKVPNQRNYLDNNLSHISLVKDHNHSADLILYTKASELLKSNPFKLYKTNILDKNYFSTVEGTLLQNGYSGTISKKDKLNLEKQSIINYTKMLEQNKHKNKAYCFVTGPSFDRYKEFDYEEDAFKVICNSTVKNDDFLEYIGGPDILTFADPVFHFSPNEYSALFRDEVLKVYRRYKPYIIVPFNTVSLILAHYPELKDRIIGVQTKQDEFHFPTSDQLWVKSSANILTLYMLPIASSVSKKIYILGADGRNPDEKYFWKHSSSAQFDDLMQTVFETHPSFFRDRDYQDYYEEHCQFLNDLIEFGEQKGKKYLSLVPSYIPVLSKKYQG